MFGPLIFVMVSVAFVVIFIIVFRSRNKNYGDGFEEFIREEAAANAVKSKEFEEGIFFVPDISLLPLKSDDGGDTESASLRRQRETLKRAKKKMLCFDAPMSNTDIKFKFGTVNLEAVSEYEENFFTFIYAVNDWTESLLEESDEAAAEAVLKAGVAYGAETSKTYMMLADLYFKKNKQQEMRELYDIVSSKKMPAQEKTWRYVNDYYNKMGL